MCGTPQTHGDEIGGPLRGEGQVERAVVPRVQMGELANRRDQVGLVASPTARQGEGTRSRHRDVRGAADDAGQGVDPGEQLLLQGSGPFWESCCWGICQETS